MMGPGEKTPEEETPEEKTPEEKTPEELYLKDLSCCCPPDNCCRDCICIYSNPCGSQYVDGKYCIPCNNAAYVIKKNEENRAEKLITKGPPLSTFTSSGPGEFQTLLAVPGTRRMGFVTG